MHIYMCMYMYITYILCIHSRAHIVALHTVCFSFFYFLNRFWGLGLGRSKSLFLFLSLSLSYDIYI